MWFRRRREEAIAPEQDDVVPEGATDNRATMAAAIAVIFPALREMGFRRSHGTLNRVTDDGVTHVVNFQLGQRGATAGRFAVNLGVFVPEMVIDPAAMPKPPVKEYECQLRVRLEEIAPGAPGWWPLTTPEATAAAVGPVLEARGLPWLGRLATREDVVRVYEHDGARVLGMAPIAPVEIAFLLAETDRAAAETLLRGYLAEGRRPEHLAWLAPHLAARGFGELLEGQPG